MCCAVVHFCASGVPENNEAAPMAWHNFGTVSVPNNAQYCKSMHCFAMRNSLISNEILGAAGGDRTHDPWLRRPILYPLSYSRNAVGWSPRLQGSGCCRWGQGSFDSSSRPLGRGRAASFAQGCKWQPASIMIGCRSSLWLTQNPRFF